MVFLFVWPPCYSVMVLQQVFPGKLEMQVPGVDETFMAESQRFYLPSPCPQSQPLRQSLRAILYHLSSNLTDSLLLTFTNY